MFGKPGRPHEDRLQRRLKIWTAVGPLIEKQGARRLTMRQAAAAACISLGGLYHYFPTKRSLVLFGLDQEALGSRIELNARRPSNPAAAVDTLIQSFVESNAFVRPAVLAALELGAEQFQSRLEASVREGLDCFVGTLRQVMPDADESTLRVVARSIRRLAFASLLDRSISRLELEAELRVVLKGVAQPALESWWPTGEADAVRAQPVGSRRRQSRADWSLPHSP
jgi:AcrR family transcriptional regulator